MPSLHLHTSFCENLLIRTCTRSSWTEANLHLLHLSFGSPVLVTAELHPLAETAVIIISQWERLYKTASCGNKLSLVIRLFKVPWLEAELNVKISVSLLPTQLSNSLECRELLQLLLLNRNLLCDSDNLTYNPQAWSQCQLISSYFDLGIYANPLRLFSTLKSPPTWQGKWGRQMTSFSVVVMRATTHSRLPSPNSKSCEPNCANKIFLPLKYFSIVRMPNELVFRLTLWRQSVIFGSDLAFSSKVQNLSSKVESLTYRACVQNVEQKMARN